MRGGDSPVAGTPPNSTLAPLIVTQPSNATVAVSERVSLGVTATGTAPLSYQWYIGDVAIFGATSSTYSISLTSSSDNGSYKVAVTNSAGTTMSSAATLSVVGVESDSIKREPAPRVSFQARTGSSVKLPAANKSWELTYKFVVPPLPTNWDADNNTFYIWGDVDFDAYGADGPYKLSAYKYNQIVPQLFLGRVLSRNDSGFNPSWTSETTWAIQSQYFWQKGSTPFAQTGPIVYVKPGDSVTTSIAFDAVTRKIVASISAAAGKSSIVIDRPFPNESSLFADWADFFTKAQSASGGDFVLSQPMLTVEPYTDKQTLCSILPFTVEGASIPGVGSSSSSFSLYLATGLPCAKPSIALKF